MSRWFRAYGFAEVFAGLMVGAYPLDEHDVAELADAGVRRVLNLTEDAEYRPGDRRSVERALKHAEIEERRLSLTDYGGLPPGELDAAVGQVNDWLDQGLRTYLHCRAGWQRSAAVAAGVVATRSGMEIEEALAYVQLRKPSASPLPHQREDLRRWFSARTDRRSPRVTPQGVRAAPPRAPGTGRPAAGA